jgi:hypothetical protein
MSRQAGWLAGALQHAVWEEVAGRKPAGERRREQLPQAGAGRWADGELHLRECSIAKCHAILPLPASRLLTRPRCLVA